MYIFNKLLQNYQMISSIRCRREVCTFTTRQHSTGQICKLYLTRQQSGIILLLNFYEFQFCTFFVLQHLRNLIIELVEEIAKKTWQQSGFLNVDRAKSVLWQSVIKELGVVGFKGACTLINNRFTNNGAGKGVYQSLQKSRTTFNIDHARWGRARDAHNSSMMDHRSNINNNRMVFGSL